VRRDQKRIFSFFNVAKIQPQFPGVSQNHMWEVGYEISNSFLIFKKFSFGQPKIQKAL
jgi:hypothetical protein